MNRSRYTIEVPLDGDKLFLLNPMTGQAAILEPAQSLDLRAGRYGAYEAEWQEMGFLVADADAELEQFTEAYAKYLAEVAKTPVQLILAPTFGCNFACTYCYQAGAVESEVSMISEEAVTHFFAYVNNTFMSSEVPPYLTLFGGEPLLGSAAARQRIGQIFAEARAIGLKVAIVTNGYTLEEYAPLLDRSFIKEVQVTLDGPQKIHNLRRPLAGGQGTFEKVAHGIDAMLAKNIPVNLRVVTDKENISFLPELAREAERRGWLDHAPHNFYTQIGRNYELYSCSGGRNDPKRLFGRFELWQEYVKLAQNDQVLQKFHQPRLSGMKHLAEEGELLLPNFDSCPATKYEWAFAPDGGIYGCTATVGNPQYRLGSFFPPAQLDAENVAVWQGRSTLTMEKCKNCAVAPFCGGGCGAVAAASGAGIASPDCRPIEQLLRLGAEYYKLDS